MFTGIIKARGSVKKISPQGGDFQITFNSNEIGFIYKGPFVYRLLKELRRFARSTSRKLLLDKNLIKKGGSIDKIILEKDIE